MHHDVYNKRTPASKYLMQGNASCVSKGKRVEELNERLAGASDIEEEKPRFLIPISKISKGGENKMSKIFGRADVEFYK